MAPEQDKGRVENGDAATGTTPFEEAVALTGIGRFHHTLLVVCGFCHISMIFESLAAAYVTPAAQCDFDMTSFEKGFLGGTIYIGMIVSSHLWGFVADTRGRRRVLLVTLALDVLCSVAAALVPSLPLLIFVRFLNGICICGPAAVTYAYLGEFHAYKTRTQSMVYACIFIAIATIAQPGTAWLVIPQPWEVPLGWIVLRSWRVFLILGAVPSAITFLGLYFLLPESPKFLLAVGKHDQALDVLRGMFASNSGLPPEKYPVAALEVDPASTSGAAVNTTSPLSVMRHMWRQTAPLFRPPYLLYTLLACVIQFGLYASCNGFLVWLPELLNRVGQYRDAYPDSPATVCDIIAVMADQAPPPVTLGLSQAGQYSLLSNMLSSVAANGTGSDSDPYVTVEDPMKNTSWWDEAFPATGEPAAASCVASVNVASFQNSLITGAGSAVAYISISFIIRVITKKTIITVSMAVSGVCGVATIWAQTELQILLLPLAFIVLSGMCISVVNTVVVDCFPTYLRAMAVCLSLCSGRLGTFVTSLMLGALIDSSCVLAIAIIGGFVIDKKRGENGVGTEKGLAGNGAAGGVATPFDDAVAMTGVGRFHHVLLAVCGMCLVAMCFEVMGIAFVTPAAECDFEMTSFEKGFLAGTINVGMMLSSHLWGYLSDTWGRHVVLALTLGLNFVCSLLSALMPSLGLVIFFRLLCGLWICGPSAVTYAYLGEFHSDKTRAQGIVYVCLFIAAALLIQPGLAWLVIPQPWAAPLWGLTLRSWRVFVIIGALPSAATFLGLWLLLPESPKFLLATGRHDQALDVLRTMFAANTGLPPHKYPVTSLQEDGLQSSSPRVNTKSALAIARHMWRQTAPLFKPPYLLYTSLACFIQFGLYASSNGFYSWLPELLNRVGQYNDAYPDDPAAVCDVITILAAQMVPSVSVEHLQANYSSTTAGYTTSDIAALANWTTADHFGNSAANWTATALYGSVANSTAEPEVCVATVSQVSFQNSLINGAGFAIAYVAVIPLVKVVSKRLILAVALIASGVCGVAVLWAQTELQVLMLPMVFVVLSGMCVSVVNVVVVDAYPTYLRAMAVCLSLCFGRLGTFITSLMLGALIDSSCVVAVSILGGYVVLCGFLSLLLPSEERLKKLRQ